MTSEMVWPDCRTPRIGRHPTSSRLPCHVFGSGSVDGGVAVLAVDRAEGVGDLAQRALGADGVEDGRHHVLLLRGGRGERREPRRGAEGVALLAPAAHPLSLP